MLPSITNSHGNAGGNTDREQGIQVVTVELFTVYIILGVDFWLDI
jgi:hypothetical protein